MRDHTLAEKMVCYYSSWAVYRPGSGKFDVENIDPFMCTHVIYSFLGVDGNGSVFSLDPWNDIDNGNV
jgi:chitinase